MSRGLNTISRYELAKVGLQIDNLDESYQNYTVRTVYFMFAVGMVLSYIVGIYLTNVLPSTPEGIRRVWYYPFTRQYWISEKPKVNQITPQESINSFRKDSHQELGRKEIDRSDENMQNNMQNTPNVLNIQNYDNYTGDGLLVKMNDNESNRPQNPQLEEERDENDFENQDKQNNEFILHKKVTKPSVAQKKHDTINLNNPPNPQNFEQVDPFFAINQEQDFQNLKIKNLKKTYSNGFQAVKNLTMNLYSGQIFALLGHNGAGKTTTISMLTGLLSSTSGSAEIFGFDLFGDITNVRKFLGVCPQHDILFDLLTPEEHLDIFCDFKGVDSKKKKEEIRKMLIDVDIYSSKDLEARKLSGGNKRKLSVAIALIGGSKFVLLDEPTAGMDLGARRKLWNMLKNYKNDRIIILTTHYMDEADILGDRIGIMVGGQLTCLGSSLFLKNRFGVGYKLTMVKKSNLPNLKVGQYLEDKLGPTIKKLSEVSSEISYQIPNSLAYKFKDFFTYFDQDLDELEIRSYGISVTTLEEVFLRVGHEEKTNQDENENMDFVNKNDNYDTTSRHFNLEVQDYQEQYSIADDHEKGCCRIFNTHMQALFKKRFLLYRRNYKALVIEVLIPAILVLIGFGFSKIQLFKSSPDRPLTPNLLPLPQRLIVNQDIPDQSIESYSPMDIISALPDYGNSFTAEFIDYSFVDVTTDDGDKVYVKEFDEDVFAARLKDPIQPYRYGSYFIYSANVEDLIFKVVTMVNVTSQDVAPLYSSFIYQAILKTVSGNPNLKFECITSPFPVTETLKNKSATANGIFLVFVVSIAFALIPAAVISNILHEREKNLKHMQLISGMNLFAYWLTNYCFDILKALITSGIAIGLMYAFELQYDYVFILFLLFPVGVIPFTYVTSFFFQSENLAQTVTILIHFIIPGIGAIVAWLLRIIQSTYNAGDILVWILRFILPSYCLTDSIMYQGFKSQLYTLRPELQVEDYDLQALGSDVIIICGHGIVYTLILILIETRVFRCFSLIWNSCKRKNRFSDSETQLDEDVIEEENRITNTPKDQLKVRVHKFRKDYRQLFQKSLIAVEQTSFGLDYGECFALLGVNGAGKSTTFKSLTGEITPTSGQISIQGFDVQKDFGKIRKLIGYCPQHDALFDLMTVEEHLYYYANLKGVKKNMQKLLILKLIQDMNLLQHRHKQAVSLSGGNKRKLSVAMSVIGNPPIIFLDEPSAGMDPEARRFMWSVIEKLSHHRKQSAVILSTHSMEEAEALSTKMGIMVKGGVFRCFGSSQHIKNKFGTGYEIEVKIRKANDYNFENLQSQYGLIEKDSIEFSELQYILRSKNTYDHIVQLLEMSNINNEIVIESQKHNGIVSVQKFLNWLYIELNGMNLIQSLTEDFSYVEILEHYNDYYKLRVPRGDKSIGFVFSIIESKKENFKISEYSASQTTLEQIFQQFANQNYDSEESIKFNKEEFAKVQTSSFKNEENGVDNQRDINGVFGSEQNHSDNERMLPSVEKDSPNNDKNNDDHDNEIKLKRHGLLPKLEIVQPQIQANFDINDNIMIKIQGKKRNVLIKKKKKMNISPTLKNTDQVEVLKQTDEKINYYESNNNDMNDLNNNTNGNNNFLQTDYLGSDMNLLHYAATIRQPQSPSQALSCEDISNS